MSQKHFQSGHTCTALDAEQIARIFADDKVTTLFTLDHGGMRAFVCTGMYEGDFTIFQSGTTGKGFLTQNADSVGESIHDEARAVLNATHG